MRGPICKNLFTLSLLLTLNAWGQAVPPQQPQDAAQQLLREQQDKQRQEQAQRAGPSLTIPKSTEDLSQDPEAVADAAPTFLIEHVDFTGQLDLLSETRLRSIASRFEGKHLGGQRIQYLLKNLTAAFVDAGYITTRCYIPEQNLQTKHLLVTVVPGRIAAITMNGKPELAWMQRQAFPMAVGDVLRLADIEQGVDNLARFKFYKPAVSIMPGQNPGESTVAFSTAQSIWSDHWTPTLGTDNQGDESTGVWRVRTGMQAGDVLGLGEDLSLSYVGGRNSNSLVATAAMAKGYNTYSVTTTYSEYLQPISDIAQLLGQSSSTNLGWGRVWQRDGTGRWSTDVSLSKNGSQRFVNGAELSPQNLVEGRISLSRQRKFEGGNAVFELAVKRGLPDGGASQDDPGLTQAAPHAQFTKLEFNGSWSWTPAGQKIQWRQQWATQWSPTGLYSAEEMYAGGTSSVRGYKSQVLVGDNGGYIRTEMASPDWAIAVPGGRLDPFAFFDAGLTEAYADKRLLSIGGAGLGIRGQMKNVSLDAALGLPVFNTFGQHLPAQFTLTLMAQF